MDWHAREFDTVEILRGDIVVWIVALVDGRIDAQVCSRFSSQMFHTLIVDLIDIVIEGSKYGTFAEVDLTFIVGKTLYFRNIWINMLDELFDRVITGRKADI
jgi:hypothetical protein